MDFAITPCRKSDTPAVVALLTAADLPTQDMDDNLLSGFLVARDEHGELVGAVGLEVHGADGLLRSLVVAPAARGSGLGAELVAAVESAACTHGVRTLFLLTTTAPDFFPRVGYEVGDRSRVPPAIAATTEFATICPSSAVMLSKRLDA